MKRIWFIGLLLIGCITDPPQQKVVHKDYSVGPECMGQEDSVTWTDTTEARHWSCVVGK